MSLNRTPYQRKFALQRRSDVGGTTTTTTSRRRRSLSPVRRLLFLLFPALLVPLLTWQKKVLSSGVITIDTLIAVDDTSPPIISSKGADGLSVPSKLENFATATDASNTTKIDYPCFPPRQNENLQHTQDQTTTVVYLETAYVNLHYETFYSFIHQICSCNNEKDSPWKINTDTTPHFYVGPDEMLTIGFENVLREYNTTTCGPIFFGTPKISHLTIVTTSYPSEFGPGGPIEKFYNRINDPRYIFICHEDAQSYPFLEDNATNVFFLTPLHRRYIIPSVFPPSIVQRHSKNLQQQQGHSEETSPPLFLVLGDFNSIYRRNVWSLQYPLEEHRDKNFTIRFLGGASGSISNEVLLRNIYDKFPKEDHGKIELLPRTDTDEFFRRVSEADVILPLVDEGNFYHQNGYQGGRKLTSSVMWGIGLRKKMILYKPLAEVFGVKEDNHTYFLHGDSTVTLNAFGEAFGRCLCHLLEHPT
mmetsp:Transcript_9039/g.22064  ORF Transcript_9039/g.22064 Transcript_9039/m.22064 type:complete len:474 (+) Transcript_9039:301-1722(+)